MKKNPFLTFCCACVPGCGQMYLGYMRRGLSLSAFFWGLSILTISVETPLLAFLLPVLWAFAFFDSFNLRNAIYMGTATQDDFIPNRAFLASYNLLPGSRGGNILGWVLIIAGGLMMWGFVVEPFLLNVLGFIPGLYMIFNNLIPTLIAAAVILLGVWMVRRPSPPQEDDIKTFGAPSQPTTPPAPSAPPAPLNQPPAATADNIRDETDPTDQNRQEESK